MKKKLIGILVSEEEHAEIKNKAHAEKKSISEYAGEIMFPERKNKDNEIKKIMGEGEIQ